MREGPRHCTTRQPPCGTVPGTWKMLNKCLDRWVTRACVSGLSRSVNTLVQGKSAGASEGLSRARSQWSSTSLLFNTPSLCCILRRWHIKTTLLDQAQNLHLYAKMKCSFLAGKKKVQICRRTSSNLELAWMNCVNEAIMVLPASPLYFCLPRWLSSWLNPLLSEMG